MHGTSSSHQADGISLRPIQWPQDAEKIASLDASYSSLYTYETRQNGLGFSLHQVERAEPFHKTYPMDDIADDARDADVAWIAEDSSGKVAGFATAAYQEWNRSVLITGIFVAPAHKQQGIGRSLLELIDQFARTTSARCLQLETQNTNVPAINFYLKAGFRLSGINVDLYDPHQVQAGEAALYFTRPLAPA